MSNEAALGHHTEIMSAVYDRINNYHKRPLHKGQIQLAKDYFNRGMKVMMSQWGRSAGKTESALFIATVAALLNDNFIIYIIAPQKKQGKEIYCAPKRLQNYPPPQYIKDFNSTEGRLNFHNGSFICIEGCENYEAHRGLKPHLVIYDEFQHHSKEFHLEVMEPNLLAKQSSLIIYGTPPKERSAYYVEFRDELLKEIKNEDHTRSYYEFPTSINPTNDPEELHKKRKRLIESDNEVIWLREYEGKLAFGGQDVVFPKWNPKVHVRKHDLVMSYLENDKHKLKWFTICDPGTSSVFAVMFVAYNPYTQQIFILDEIYEKDRKHTDSMSIWNRIRKKEAELYPLSTQMTWKRIYDEQAAWFHREICANHKGQQISLSPSRKQHTDEDTDISNIKILMSQENALVVSDRCYWLRWEIESFITDEQGRYPDRNNHLIDSFKYLMQTCGWKLIEKAEQDLVPVVVPGVAMPNQINVEDWADNVVENSLSVNQYDYLSEYFN